LLFLVPRTGVVNYAGEHNIYIVVTIAAIKYMPDLPEAIIILSYQKYLRRMLSWIFQLQAT
jgi:hypothetical protein